MGLMELRDRAAMVAINFAGQTIDSYDGTYNLLIDCIYDALFEVAQSKGMVVEKIYLRATEQSPFTVCSECPELPKRRMWLGFHALNSCDIHPETTLRHATWQERANYLGWVLDRMQKENAETRREAQT